MQKTMNDKITVEGIYERKTENARDSPYLKTERREKLVKRKKDKVLKYE